MEESVFSQSPFSNESSASSGSSNGSPSRRGKKLLFLINLLVILGLIAFGAVKFLGGSVLKGPAPTPTPTAAPTPTDTPTPTPEPSGSPTPTPKGGAKTTATPTPTKTAGSSVDKATGLNRANLTVEVQNGSGIAGAAKKAGDMLSGLGYTLGTVGNAPTSNFTQTEIHVKAADAKYLPLLKKDLGASYTVGTAAADYTGAGDALVIVGQQ